MWAIVGTFGKVFYQWLFGGGGGDSTQQIRDALVGVWGMFAAISAYCGKLFGNWYRAWQYAAPEIIDGANGFGETSYAAAGAWARLLFTILPTSQRWQDGRQGQRWFEFLHGQWNPFTSIVKSAFRYIFDWEASYDHWHTVGIKDIVNRWQQFHTWFNGWPVRQVETVHDWTQHPDHLSNWIAPHMTVSILRYLARRGSRGTLNILSVLVLLGIGDEPHYAADIMVKVLDSEGW